VSRLREHDFDPRDHKCAECEVRDPIGPCGACEAMICGDCGVMTKDPGGRRVICLSCARLVAAVSDNPVRRRRGRGATWTAVAIALLIAFGATVINLLLR